MVSLIDYGVHEWRVGLSASVLLKRDAGKHSVKPYCVVGQLMRGVPDESQSQTNYFGAIHW